MAPAPKTGGDDLDDGLELDPTLLASDDEAAGVASDAEDAAGYLSDEEEPAGVKQAGVKRKARGDGGEGGGGEGEGGEDLEEAKERKRRRREKDKARKKAKRLATAETPPPEPTRLDPAAVHALLLASARAAMPASSAMEIDDVAVPEERILPPLIDDGEEGGFAPLVARLNDLLKDAPKKPKPGTPRALILCLSGLRCADVVRAVRDVKRHGEVAKLFAKHFKLADQVKYLAKTRVSVAVGTPARVAKLLEEGALKLSAQSAVLVDIGHRDSKNRTLLTLPEVRDELWRSLLSGTAREALKPAKFAAF